MENKIVFVDKDDHAIGAGTRTEAWEKGIAHRIARIFVFNSKGQLLLQKRSPNLKSAPDKWDDSAAGHVDDGEEYLEAARRELAEELGIKKVGLTKVAKFYTEGAGSADSISKKRFHMLYQCVYDGDITFNRSEISEVKWVDLSELKQWLAEKPDDFAGGFKVAFREYLKTL